MAAEPFLRRDPRTIDWELAGNKQFLIILFVAYVYIAKPYDGIKPLIIVYNAAMVLLNCYFVAAFLSKSYLGGGYNLLCQGINYEAHDEVTMSVLTLCWWYLMVRIADFLDTFFFVLRKKDSHISFLHVVHHILVITFGVILNSFVHVVMYSYYFLSLLGPSMQKHLWWKRYLTQLQLVQFVMIFLHTLMPLFISCGYPRPHTYIMLCELVFFFAMFVRFYLKAYMDKEGPSIKGEAVKNKAH
ncbi:hypothetical protein HPB49_012430 [Dermacentor silvarum]|uniref:Uncharacterized protein n=1 Tax=Dermacentor silvarum TaxID=543639 RepID=A0ACB8C3J8_DERSI|nr:hypothetical protein HPB49_012430 [Dermacentor silvarum]